MLRANDLTGKVQPGMPVHTFPLRAEVRGALWCRELRQRAADVREHAVHSVRDIADAGNAHKCIKQTSNAHSSLLMLRAVDLTGRVQPGCMPFCALPLRAEVLGAL